MSRLPLVFRPMRLSMEWILPGLGLSSARVGGIIASSTLITSASLASISTCLLRWFRSRLILESGIF